jgi:proline utilization trans-activator
MGELSKWLRELPPALSLDFNKLDKAILRESVSIFLHYYQCTNLTARPLLFHVVRTRLQDLRKIRAKPDWKDGLSKTMIDVIEACIVAARSSISIMAAAAKQNLVGKLDLDTVSHFGH